MEVEVERCSLRLRGCSFRLRRWRLRGFSLRLKRWRRRLRGVV